MRRSRDPDQLELLATGTPRTGDELLARLRALGLRAVHRCTLTRNRRVMVTIARGELRLHEGYLQAPEAVWRAIVTFAQGRTRAQRAAARRVLLAHPVTDTPAPPRRERTHPDDEPLVARLRLWHAQLNAERFGGTLRTIPLRVSRRMRSRLGHYVPSTSAEGVEIVISRRHLRRDPVADVLDTLLHEMVHQWQDETGLPVDHGAAFRRKAREVGATPAAKRVLPGVQRLAG
ncbi:MAG TPA: SprT-like domain-containing protein [Gemmatimonadaceae bacterium]|nr:SprT-like domain-containing protein [Gemmatimonadaceae bacterium]